MNNDDLIRMVEIIKEVSAEDIFLIVESQEVISKNLDSSNLDFNNYCWVMAIDENDKGIGFIQVTRNEPHRLNHTASISIVITKEYRNMGIGTHLLKIAEMWAKQVNIKKLCLEVVSTNNHAHYIYQKLGYIEEGIKYQQVYSENKYVDEIIMGKWLD